MIERNGGIKNSNRSNSSNINTNVNNNINNINPGLPITANGFYTTTSTPNYQLSGIQPNYTYANQQNLNFDTSKISRDGFSTQADLQKAVIDQQNYVNAYNQFQPSSTFNRPEFNSAKNENLRDFSQFNVRENFTENKPLMTMLDTTYKHNTIYDNLNDNLMKETIQEVRLNIDSYDRDVAIYPNPFDYVVKLGPIVNSGINPTVVSKRSLKEELRNNLKIDKKKFSRSFNPGNPNNPLISKTITELDNIDKGSSIEITADAFLFDSPELIVDYTNNLKQTNNPYLVRNFDNVKFIRLDCGILPKFNGVRINPDWSFCRHQSHIKKFIRDDYDRLKDYTILNYRYIPDDTADYALTTDRFVQIFIKEIRNNYNLGTNPITDKSFVLVFDKSLGILYWRGVPYSAVQTYKDSLLGEINELSIQFYDSWGNPLSIDYSKIAYEQNQILDTDLIKPDLLFIEKYIGNEKATKWIIEKLTEILKCFIIINYDIVCKIPFYNPLLLDENDTSITDLSKLLKNSALNNYSSGSNVSGSSSSTSNTSNSSSDCDFSCFNDKCENVSKVVLNQQIFNIQNIYKELNSFVSPTSQSGFIPAKKLTKSGKIVNVTIDQYIANVFWFDFIPAKKEYIDYNINSFVNNYKNFGFNILDKLKNELINLPANKLFQNYLTFVMGVYTNELSTKVDYTNS